MMRRHGANGTPFAPSARCVGGSGAFVVGVRAFLCGRSIILRFGFSFNKRGSVMSAFMVDTKTIDKAVSLWARDAYGQCPGEELPSCEDMDNLGRDMLRANRDAVMARYGGDPEEVFPTEAIEAYRYPLKWVPRVVAYKSLQCLRYQCAEGPVLESAIYHQMGRKLNATAHALVQAMPEYESAPWG